MSEKICLHHVCLRVSSLKQAEIFYSGFLGLKKLYEFTVSAEHAQILFNITEDCHFVSFECPDGGGLEIFSCSSAISAVPVGCHVCLGVIERESLLEELRQANVTIREVSREGRKIVFVLDPDDNLIELKELAT